MSTKYLTKQKVDMERARKFRFNLKLVMQEEAMKLDI